MLRKLDKMSNWKPVCNCKQCLTYINHTDEHVVTKDLSIIKQLDLHRNNIYKINSNKSTKNSLFYIANMKQSIANIHNEFVIVPIDKASNHFAVILSETLLGYFIKRVKHNKYIRKDE
jgi:hypothetical protein